MSRRPWRRSRRRLAGRGGAGVADLAIVVLRLGHLALVAVALVLVFRPAANAFFRR
jgi:hypothetical protein